MVKLTQVKKLRKYERFDQASLSKEHFLGNLLPQFYLPIAAASNFEPTGHFHFASLFFFFNCEYAKVPLSRRRKIEKLLM